MKDVSENKIRVLHVMGSSSIGGAEKMFLSLVKHFDASKFEIYIACPCKGELAKKYALCAKKIFHLNLSNIFNLFAIFSLIRIMKKYSIDIVHTHLPSADLLGIISARLVGVKHVFSTLYGMNFLGLTYRGVSFIRKFILSKYYRIIYIMADRIIAVSNAVKEDLISRSGIRLNQKKIIVINNPGETNIFNRNNADIDIRNSYRYDIGVFANFYKIKGHEFFIRALALMKERRPDIQAILLGHGKEKSQIHNMINELGLGKNILMGGISLNVNEVMKECRIVVLPSLSEGFPLVLIEASFLGKPIVATRVGGIPEIIEDGVNGILVPPYDSKKLVTAIESLLDNPYKAINMGNVAFRYAAERFFIEDTANRTQQAYEEVFCYV